MPDYIQTTAEKWLTENGFKDTQVVRVHDDGLMLPCYLHSILEEYAMLIIDHAVETCNSHSDSEIDKDGSKVNLYAQFGLD